ncbi:Hypothetical predicted protein, partial [Paramuricea clavata]
SGSLNNMAAGTTYWAAPKQLNREGNVSYGENYRKFDEHWALFEKTEMKGKSEEERCSYFSYVSARKDARSTKRSPSQRQKQKPAKVIR